MMNPWINLPKIPPYVLDSDKESVLSFNATATLDYKIHDELLPEPFLGNPRAKIILLNLNPGYSESDLSFHHEDKRFIELSRMNLMQKHSEFSFYLLNPEISESPGHIWWVGKLKELISLYGLKIIASNICCIEYFPYHTKKFKKPNHIFRSQHYAFEVVREAIKRHSLIVIMRAKKIWLEAVPELKTYHYYTLNSFQNVAISRKNLPNGFGKITEILDLVDQDLYA